MAAKTAWAHLPNARHIDAVLADVRKRPKAWGVGGSEDYTAVALAACVQDVVLRDRREVARHAALSAAQKALQHEEWSARRHKKWAEVTYVTDALIAWDSSADLLDCTPDVLRAMIDLAEPPVCHQAVLLLPYAIVRSNDK